MSVLSSVVGNVTLAARVARSYVRSRRLVERLDAIETLAAIVDGDLSLARFGDGELHYALQGKHLNFQPWRMALARRLHEALLLRNDRVLACFNHHAASADRVPYVADFPRYKDWQHSNPRTPSNVSVLHRPRARRAYARYWRLIETETQKPRYGEASVFFLSIYVDAYRHGEMAEVLALAGRLFAGRRILFVAPERPVGGPSFRELAPDMKRLGLAAADYINIPATDAFAAIDGIEAAILAAKGFDDVFIQAGPVATVLASELAGRIDARILDVGSLNTQVRFLPGSPAPYSRPFLSIG